MRDIKSLYLAAKTSGKSKDIASYTEAINDLFESDPNGYVLNLEYIIKSDIGLKTLKPFIEKYGFPIALYDTMIESLNDCIEKCHQLNKDDSLYTETMIYFENWKLDHLNCFMMFENFGSNLPSNYVTTYYGSNSKGIQNRKLVAGMINTFGEAAIPDMIITADSINGTAVKTVFEYVKGNESYKNPTMYEWMSRISEDVDNIDESVNSLIFFNENCLTTIVNGIRNRQQKLYKESVILQNNDILMEYSDSDLEAIQSLIFFKEYEMTWADEFTEKSHGKLKYDYRRGFNIENGHAVLVVYSLDDINVYYPGHGYELGCPRETNVNNPKVNAANKEVQKTIAKKGNPDHLSKGQKVVAIKDLYDNKNLKEVNIEGFYNGITKYSVLKLDEEDLAALQANRTGTHIKVGEIDNSATFKSTKAFPIVKKDSKRFGQLDTNAMLTGHIENLKYARGAKLNDIDPRDDLKVHQIKYKHPSKKDIRDNPELYNKESYAIQLQNEIYSLYEEFDGILNPDGTPTPEALNESKWIVNTRNKKTGEAPDYLKNNHDLGYGEEDDTPGDSSKSEPESSYEEPGLDEFKRPSAEDLDGSTAYSGLDDNNEDKEVSQSTSSGGNTNNYYYYTYTNSLNKNSNSYNKSHTDDHSTNKGNNRDNEIHDNHSSGDNRGNHYTGITPTQESVNHEKVNSKKIPKFLIAEKKTRFAIKPDVNVNLTLKVSNKDWKTILDAIEKVNKYLLSIIKKYSDKYPAYGLTTSYDASDNMFYKEKDGQVELDVRKIDDKFIFDLQLPAIVGLSFQNFFANLEKEHPEEFGKYKSMDKWDLSEIWWNEKLLGYDKSLTTIIADIEKELKSEIKEIFAFGFWDDWDDIYYGYYLPASYLYPKFNEKDIISGDSRSSKLAASITDSKLKHMMFKKKDETFEESCYMEEVGDADDNKPESDHPIKDTLQDIDKELTKHQQKAKKKVQDIQNAGRAFVKPIKRTEQWISKMVYYWKDKDETKIKEKMADPHARNSLFSAIRKAIVGGSLLKAGLLLNPIFLFLTATRGIGKNKKEFRLRNEMIGELKTELNIIDEKIKDADRLGDMKAKYRLMRLKNEINKKLLRVGGDKQWKKFI